jgi:ornithine cyclodeaminase
MKSAYSALSTGRAEVPLRLRLPIKPNDGLSILMPAFVDDEAGQALAVKIVSLFDNNPSKGLPLIHAGVLVLNPETGSVEALLEGGSLTAIRTGAGAGAATDVLARKDAKTLAIFGAGVQARTQLQAACEVRDIHSVWVYDPDQNQVKTFIEDMAGRGRIPKNLRAAHNSTEAVIDADITSTATTSSTPVFIDSDLKPGVHINGVGAYTLQMQEIPSDTVARARVTVDSRTAAQVESGDIANPLSKGLFKEADVAEIGEVIAGTKPGRTSSDQITVFKSVGIAVQDAVAARLAVENARKLGLGTEVAW